MTLHAPLMALVDAEQQRVVAWRGARGPGDAHVPRFHGRGKDRGGSDTRLEEYGVDIGALQLVQDGNHLLSLLGGRVGVWPVDAADGGEPDGSYFVFGSLCE